MPTKLNVIAWTISLPLTAYLVWSAARHGMPLLEVAAIALLVLNSAKAGADNLVAAARAARSKNGAAR